MQRGGISVNATALLTMDASKPQLELATQRGGGRLIRALRGLHRKSSLKRFRTLWSYRGMQIPPVQVPGAISGGRATRPRGVSIEGQAVHDAAQQVAPG